MLALIGWTAQSVWLRAGLLHDNLSDVQLQSFKLADHIQQSILDLNKMVFRFALSRDTNDWAQFERASKDLDDWIDLQRHNEPTAREVSIHDLINTNYDFYLDAARVIAAKVRTNTEASIRIEEFSGFETRAKNLLDLGFKLADAHRESMNSSLADSHRALSYLRSLLEISLALLAIAVSGFALMVYRGTIAPLRIKLVESQALMERQEKLASLGMLAAGVAHEIRNPLTAIKAWLYIQQKHLAPGSPEYNDAEIIGKEIGRLERIVKDVLLFARPSEPHFLVLPAEEVIGDVQRLLAPQFEKLDIRLVRESSVTANIRIDRNQIQQVLINLIQNAADSIGRNGTVVLRVRVAGKRLADQSSETVILEVADSGKGISPEVEKRLFDPFFTTKESGTGLGLSIAARIVEKHGGVLQYQTQLNHGSTFGIVLPRVS
jgi:signal transduction histidine kinase